MQDAIGEKMNKTERKAFNWLLKQGIHKNDITFQSCKNPDFIFADGRGYEAKTLVNRGITTTLKQLKELREDNPIILLFSPSDDEPAIAAPFKDVEKMVNVYVFPESRTICITHKQKHLLDSLKIHRRQPYHEIIGELLKPLELPVFTPEEKKDFLEKIERLRASARKRMEKK